MSYQIVIPLAAMSLMGTLYHLIAGTRPQGNFISSSSNLRNLSDGLAIFVDDIVRYSSLVGAI